MPWGDGGAAAQTRSSRTLRLRGLPRGGRRLGLGGLRLDLGPAATEHVLGLAIHEDVVGVLDLAVVHKLPVRRGAGVPHAAGELPTDDAPFRTRPDGVDLLLNTDLHGRTEAREEGPLEMLGTVRMEEP